METELSKGVRWGAGILGVCLLVLSLGSALISPRYLPLVHSRFESRSNGVWTAIYDRIPNEAMILALAVAGLAFILFALNGLRLKKIALLGGEVSTVDRSVAEEVITEWLKTDGKPDIPTKATYPRPIEPPLFIIKRESATYEVYGVLQLPWQLMTVLFSEWPNDFPPPPPSLHFFAAAIRRRGEGNQPWIIKFHNLRPLVVSYESK